MTIFKGRVYDALKWVTLIVIPACGTAYFGLSQIWGWPFASSIPATLVVVETLLGALLGISSAGYYQEMAKTAADEAADAETHQ